MEFAKLRKYNMRNIFLETSYTKWGGGASTRPCYKKSKLSTSLNQQSEMVYSLLILNVPNVSTKIY